MTDRERYLRAFSVLQPLDDWMDQIKTVAPKTTRHNIRRLIAGLVAAILVLGLIGAAYAADMFGIQGRVRITHLGKQLDLDVKTGWTDDGLGGEPHQMYVFYNEQGVEVFRYPVESTTGKTSEEILNQIQEDNVSLDTRNCVLSEDNRRVLEWVNGNHSIYIHYFGQSIDIGDYFDENGFGRYSGEIWQGKHGQWVEVLRTVEEPWWHFSVYWLGEEP